MSDTQRTLLTFSLVALLTLAIPFYLQIIGVAPGGEEKEKLPLQKNKTSETIETDLQENKKTALLDFQPSPSTTGSVDFVVQTDLFRAELSSLSGGSFSTFSIILRDELNKLYLSISTLVIGLISVEEVKVVLGFTILKPKTNSKEITIIDAIFHLPSQTVCIKLSKSISSSYVDGTSDIIHFLYQSGYNHLKKLLIRFNQ